MQNTITNTMAFGFDGEHANGQPFRADAYIASSEITFGTPAIADGVSADGFLKAKNATSGTYIGMFVGAHQHVKMALASDDHAIKVPSGTDVAVAARGCWFVTLAAAVEVGDKLKVDSGAYVKATLPTDVAVVVGTIIAVDDTGKRAIVRLGE